MTDRFEAMSMLLSVVDEGSLSAAARKREVPLPTVSRKIGELERHLGTRLFQRAGRGLVLTDTGQEFVAACRRIVEDVAEAERAASGEYRTPKGRLTITAPIVFGRLHALPVILEFLKTYPEIDVRLIQADRVFDLPEEHVDLAIRIGKVPDSSLILRSVGTIRRVVCASPGYLRSRGRPTTPSELAHHDCIDFEGLQPVRSWSFRRGNAETAVAIRSRLAVNTAESAVDAAMAGLGLTRVLSYQIAAPLAEGRLETVLDGEENDPWPVSIIYPSRGLVAQKLRVFVDFAAPRLRARLAGAIPSTRLEDATGHALP